MDDPANIRAAADGYDIGELVPFHYLGKYVALSFFVSLLGNFLTVSATLITEL